LYKPLGTVCNYSAVADLHTLQITKASAKPQLKRLVAGFPPRRPGLDPGCGQVGFVVDKVVLGQVFSEYFGFPCQSSFHQLLHNHPHLSGAGTVGQKWPQYKCVFIAGSNSDEVIEFLN
jgi:hypothetical protein